MAVSGLGTGVGVTLSDGVNDAYADVLSISLSGMNCGSTDISSASSASQFRESLPGLIDAGYLTCVLRYGTTLGTAADAETEDLSDLHANRTVSTWTLTIPGGESGGTWVCSGFIAKLGQAVHYKGGVQIQVVIKLTGIPAWTVAS